MLLNKLPKGAMGYYYPDDLDGPPTVSDRQYVFGFGEDSDGNSLFSSSDTAFIDLDTISDHDTVIICNIDEILRHTVDDVIKTVNNKYKEYTYIVFDTYKNCYDAFTLYLSEIKITADNIGLDSIHIADVCDHLNKKISSARYIFIYFDNNALIENAKNPKKANTMFTSPAPVAIGQTSTPVISTNDIVRSVDRCVYDFTTGRLGVKKTNAAGFSVFVKGKDNKKPSITACELKDFSRPIPAIAIRTKIDKINIGDVVIIKDGNGQENWLYFLSAESDGGDTTNVEISGIEADTGKKVSVAVQDGVLFDGKSILAVKNYFGEGKMKDMLIPMMLMQQSGNGQPMNPLMVLMMTGGLESIDKSLLPFLLMGQQGAAMNPMLMMLMMKDGEGLGDMKSMLPLLLMGGGGMDQNMMMMMMLMTQKEENK